MSAAAAAKSRGLGWALIAVVAVAVLLAAFFVTRAVTSSQAPDTPSGLAVETTPGSVTLTWDAVDEAESYQVIRDGDAVVYTGSETSAVDRAVRTGNYTYQVQAISDGLASPASAGESADVADGWGEYAPLAAQFPSLLPPGFSTPSETGTHCAQRYAADSAEYEAVQAGDNPVYSVFRLICATSEDETFALFWYASPDDLNTSFERADTGDVTEADWDHGSGLVADNRAMLKFDTPERDSVLMLTWDVEDGPDAIDVANRLDIS